MPQQGITFQGAFIGLPGAYYADDVSAALPTTPPVTPPMIVIGYGFGPKPLTPVTFTNPIDFLNAVRGGPVSGFIPFIANPSPQLNGAQLITYIDASDNTQSSAGVLASGGGTYAVLTSTMYGPPSNLLQYQVTAGSLTGLKFTLIDQYGRNQLVGDNLTAPFQVAYTGAATGGLSYTANATGFILTSPTAGESTTIPVGGSGYATVSQLVQAINGTGYWLAQIISGTQGQLPASGLTAVSGALTAVSGTIPQYSYVNAFLTDIAFWVNTFGSAYATMVVSGAAGDVASWLPKVVPPTYFTGATGVPPTNNDYADALNVALGVPGWTVFCDSNAVGVQSLLAQHCETASSVPYGMWRRGFTGSQVGESVATSQANALALDSKETVYCAPGIIWRDTATNMPVTGGGLYVAAMSAAMATGNRIATPLTHKALRAIAVEQLLTQSQIIALQNTGVQVTYLEQANNLPTILSDITTWQVDNNAENTSSQQVACRFWLAYSVTNTLKQYVGTIASTVDEVVILKALIRTLNALIHSSPTDNGVLESWDRNSLVLKYTGSNQVAAITFNATLVGQNRYITVFVPIQPLNIVVTAANVQGA